MIDRLERKTHRWSVKREQHTRGNGTHELSDVPSNGWTAEQYWPTKEEETTGEIVMSLVSLHKDSDTHLRTCRDSWMKEINRIRLFKLPWIWLQLMKSYDTEFGKYFEQGIVFH
jgi:hypothetical protein